MARLTRFAVPFLTLALAVPLSFSCGKKASSPTGLLERAAREAEDADASSRAFALAGFHAYLVQGDAERARALFEQALRKGADEPYAHYGMISLARRAGQPRQALDAALTLCERAPRHPLCAASARVALELAGSAPGFDEAVKARAPGILAQQPLAETAHLLRSALAVLAQQHEESDRRDEILGAMGAARHYSVVGPFHATDLLEFDVKTPPESDGSLVGPFRGALGPLPVREVHFPDGRFSLAGEPTRGDGFILAVDATVTTPGKYVVRTVTSSAHRVWLNGSPILERRSFERFLSSVTTAGVELQPGTYRIVTKLVKDDREGGLTLSLLRADGAPSNVRFAPAKGPAPKGYGQKLERVALTGVYPEPEDLYRALAPEAGPLLATFVAVHDGMDRDADGARRVLSALGDLPLSAPMLALRANLALADRAAPPKVSHGRATRDFEASLSKDGKNVHALVQRGLLALDDARLDEARALLARAREAHTPVGPPVHLFDARLALAVNVEAEVERAALAALESEPGLCEALNLRYELARRQDAVGRADSLLTQLSRCPGARTRLAEHARVRGKPQEAIALYEKLVAQDPTDVLRTTTLSNLYITARRFDDAVTLLERLRKVWPRNASILKRLADVHEFAGRNARALELREEALSLDGSDLQLLRSVSRARTGKEPLSEYAHRTDEAIAAFEKSTGGENAAAAYVLDAATVKIAPDGSMLDRVHVIQKVLDQSGIQDVAEVNIPDGAQVLTLRTLKRDGRSLEPENIEGKDSISMPGVQVGDYVEYEYLLAHAARAPVMPGATPATFFFQISGQPNAWTTYRVIAPKSMGLELHAKNGVEPRPIVVKGDEAHLHHEERQVPPFIPEPNQPPQQEELLPLVTANVGQKGNEGLLTNYADAFLDRGRISHEVEVFARTAAAGKKGREAVRALYEAVMQKLSGRDAGLAMGAAASVTQDRGSRLWLLKASLAAVGIPSRLVAVRTFAVDPQPSPFPNEQQFPYVALRVELEDGPIWLDPMVRFSPFGDLPEQARGEREAYLLPEPGRPIEALRTPKAKEVLGKKVELALTLAADGKLTGEGTETYEGFDGAQLSESLKGMSEDQRNQALQSALARYFNGAALLSAKVEPSTRVGMPLVVRYRFEAPRFARLQNGQLVLAPFTYPAMLGRRYVQLGSRRTPLYIDNTERTRTHVTMTLPEGFALRGEPTQTKEVGRFGAYSRNERVEGQTLRVDEDLQLNMARIPPTEYDAFAGFAGEVDLIQTRELVLEPRG